ncbi:EF-hand domain-containing protein 1 [Anabrus simplex]|uniref:EF-hand domain-containing protein 1 n=1 Tax=Anabrus simplex TaxID=316456 RepID=UPI0035A2A564
MINDILKTIKINIHVGEVDESNIEEWLHTDDVLPGHHILTDDEIVNKSENGNLAVICKMMSESEGEEEEEECFTNNHVPLQTVLDFDPALTYGRTKERPLPIFVPHYVSYSGKCLTFNAFFKQSVFESPTEHYRVRKVNIMYYLEDDTICVMETPVENSGLVQGKLVRRGKIPKNNLGDTWHWRDFNIGIDVALYGIVYHIVDCDVFTKEYLASQGVELNDVEEMPVDPYIMDRQMRTRPSTTVTPSTDSKLRRFLEFGGRVLRFNAAWDNRDAEYGTMTPYIFYYFLDDDTVKVQEVHTKNDGRDLFPLLLNKMKLPKDWKDVPIDFPSNYMEISDAEVTEYYTPKDFLVGNTIFVLGRRLILYDADKFTREYYQKMLNITQPPAIDVFEKPKVFPPPTIPPHIMFGSPEDTYQSCLSVIPVPPRKDVARYLLNANQYLRYTARLDWVHPEDEKRQFVISYSLATGSITILEPPIRNSGFKGGMFLKPTQVPRPGTDPDYPEFYSPVDLYIGAKINVFEHIFIITGAELHVYRYMQDNPDKFPKEVVDNVRCWLAGEGLLKEDIQCRLEDKKEEERVAATHEKLNYDDCMEKCNK